MRSLCDLTVQGRKEKRRVVLAGDKARECRGWREAEKG
jgi:hypothetical protein